MSSNMTIKVEFLPGTSVEHAIMEAKIKASLWNVAYVCFDFNGVRFSISAKADIEKALAKWEKVISETDAIHKHVCI